MIILNNKNETIISFSDVVNLKLHRFNFTSYAFSIVLKNNKKYRFSPELERVEYIIESLLRFNPNLLNDDKYTKLIRELTLSDHSYSRINQILQNKNLLIIAFSLIILPVIFIILLYLRQSQSFIIYNPLDYFIENGSLLFLIIISSSVFFTNLINRVINNHTKKKLDINLNDKTRDTQYESKIYRKFFPIYIFLMLLCFFLVYLTDINTLGKTSLVNDSSFSNIKKGETLWYDTRYNCIKCNFNISNGDIIITKGGYLMKITGLSGETAFLNKIDTDETEEKIIPHNMIAATTLDGNFTMLIYLEYIKGKIFKKIPHFN